MELELSKLVFLLMLSSMLEGHTTPAEEVADRVGSALSEFNFDRNVKFMSEIPPIASKYLQGYTDEDKTRGIQLWMNRQKLQTDIYRGNGQQLPSVVDIPPCVGDLLLNDPEMIKNTSELQKLLVTEDEPSRFFFCRIFQTTFSVEEKTSSRRNHECSSITVGFQSPVQTTVVPMSFTTYLHMHIMISRQR